MIVDHGSLCDLSAAPAGETNPPAAALGAIEASPWILPWTSHSIWGSLIAMLNTITLSDEELGMLFGPALYGAVCTPTPGRKSPSHAPIKRSTAIKRERRSAKAKSTMKHLGVVPARCGYRTGKCQNLQTLKRNGKLHKLCEFHRERANLNQKKLDRKKRMQRSTTSRTSGSPAASISSKDEDEAASGAGRSPRTVEAAVSSTIFVTGEPDMEPTTDLIRPTNLNEAPLALGYDELAIFCYLMTHDDVNRTPSCPYSTSTV